MLWSQEELTALRHSSMMFLLTTNKISENEIGTQVFTCDLCTKADDCEWVFHFENIRRKCLKEEVENGILEKGD